MCIGIRCDVSIKCFLLSSTFAFGVEEARTFEKHFPFSRDRNLQ